MVDGISKNTYQGSKWLVISEIGQQNSPIGVRIKIKMIKSTISY
jgi:hypothetical protein